MDLFLKNRKAQKYLSDIFINPTKTVALIFPIPGLILAGCIAFAIAEFIHCRAHIVGALHKKKSRLWKAAKVSILVSRLLGSLTGATALFLYTLLGSMALSAILLPVFAMAFIAATFFSTIHKIRGLLDHLLKPETPGLVAHAKQLFSFKKNDKSPSVTAINKTFALIGRAFAGLLGSGLSILVVLKIGVIMSLIANPIGFGIGAAVLGAMLIQKALKAYKHYRSLQVIEKKQDMAIDPLLLKKQKPKLMTCRPRSKSLPVLFAKNKERNRFFYKQCVGGLAVDSNPAMSCSPAILTTIRPL